MTAAPRLSLPDPLTTIIFDIDGTLYRQGPLRRAMLRRLLTGFALNPVKGFRTMAALQAYRRAQEHLRDDAGGDVAATQIRMACERTKMEHEFVAACVERWMEREPLPLLSQFVQPGLVDFLTMCKARGLRLGALSDYPAEAKLEALGIAGFFDVALCAQSADIGVFKPHPQGLRVALARLHATSRESLYVGDRADVDAAAAVAAGIPCAILSPRRSRRSPGTYLRFSSYAELARITFGDERRIPGAKTAPAREQ